jgi:hypothetical protein
MMEFTRACDDVTGMDGKRNEQHPGFDDFRGSNTAEERPGICPYCAEIQYRKKNFEEIYEKTHVDPNVDCQDTKKQGDLQWIMENGGGSFRYTGM